MSQNHHTPYTTGAKLNSAILNAPLGELDAAITALAGGASVDNEVLKEWTSGECFELTAITYNATYTTVVASATVKWPDGSAGTLTVTTTNTTWLAIDAYTISHTASGKTVTQTAVTRNANGGVTVKPALTVA